MCSSQLPSEADFMVCQTEMPYDGSYHNKACRHAIYCDESICSSVRLGRIMFHVTRTSTKTWYGD